MSMGNVSTAKRKLITLQKKAQTLMTQYQQYQQQLMQWQNCYNNLNNQSYVNCNYVNPTIYARDYSKCEQHIKTLSAKITSIEQQYNEVTQQIYYVQQYC